MTRRANPLEADHKRAMNLVWECFESRDDQRAARQHLAQGIGRLVGAYAVLEGGGRLTATARETLHEPVLWGPQIVGIQLKKYHDCDLLFSDPFRRAAMDKLRRSEKGWTGARQQLVDDQVWYRSTGFEFRRTAGVDGEIKSVITTDSHGGFSMVVVQRALGQREFNGHEVKLVEFIHGAAIGILKRPRHDQFEIPRLTRVQNETLRLAIQGKEDHEIAAALCKSRRTVSDDMSTLFRIFDVRDRKELLGLFIDPTIPHDLVESSPRAHIAGFTWLAQR